MKYYDLARFIVSFFPRFVETATQGVHRIPCDIRSVRFKQLCGGTSREFQTSMESRMSFHVPWLLGQVRWCFFCRKYCLMFFKIGEILELTQIDNAATRYVLWSMMILWMIILKIYWQHLQARPCIVVKVFKQSVAWCFARWVLPCQVMSWYYASTLLCECRLEKSFLDFLNNNGLSYLHTHICFSCSFTWFQNLSPNPSILFTCTATNGRLSRISAATVFLWVSCVLAILITAGMFWLFLQNHMVWNPSNGWVEPWMETTKSQRCSKIAEERTCKISGFGKCFL